MIILLTVEPLNNFGLAYTTCFANKHLFSIQMGVIHWEAILLIYVNIWFCWLFLFVSVSFNSAKDFV